MSRCKDGRGFRVNFSVPELGETLSKISAYDGRTAQQIENAVQNSTKKIKEGARRRVPRRKGDLEKSITTRFNRKSVTGAVVARKPYAHLVELGAKATTVKPKTKKALKIPWSGLGVEGANFAASAHIPQRRARPYMRPSFEEEKPNLIRGLKEAVQPDH